MQRADAPYDWRVVDDLLEIGSGQSHGEAERSGLVEMQRWLRKWGMGKPLQSPCP